VAPLLRFETEAEAIALTNDMMPSRGTAKLARSAA